MPQQTGRYNAPAPATTAEGWTLERLTPPSRLHGANGINTGKDGRIYVAQVGGSQVSAINPDTAEIEGRAAFFDLSLDGRWGGIITGDRVRIEMKDARRRSIFGAIEQEVAAPQLSEARR